MTTAGWSYSADSVKSKDFLQGTSNSPMQMIDGKVAGVSVSNTAAADPNANPNYAG